MSVSFSGELEFEVHVPKASLYAAYLTLSVAGKEFGMKLFGCESWRIHGRMEKGFLSWKSALIN